ncbi:protein naked cuticle homolog 2 isoform X1 [Nematostella vectensis]|uniref:protein naked cuticle homolog 2 isoform X1 n=1 Tax=Nematostella vectensis TaxID=45351 RepID=UPI002076EC97|nr:protein naked cuticle homolog 2 isoform X1 [Nematostella vectensis]
MKKLHRKLKQKSRDGSESDRAWISREGPEGDCVIENDTTTHSCAVSTSAYEELSRAPSSHTADFTYKGYPVNLEWPLDYEEKELPSKKDFFYDDFPLEVVELPDLPDGKNVEISFEREGLVEASTQTKPLKQETPECGMSVKSASSDHQEWSYTLYDFEGQGQVTREDLRNLVKSIYEVLGKSVNNSRNQPKDPLKKLRVRLSVSKERGKRTEGDVPSRHEYTISAMATENKAPKKSTRTYHMERCDSMTVNPPSLENIPDKRKMVSLIMEQPGPTNGINCQSHRQKISCKRSSANRPAKPAVTAANTGNMDTPVVNDRGMYSCPKRMQTGPGECNPPSPKETNDLSRVKQWVDQLCAAHELETVTRSKHRKSYRHTCRQGEPRHDLHRCPQYLDLATDHITYPYHVESQACLYGAASPKPHRRPKRGHHHSCKYSKDEVMCQRTIVHRHEHHHSHHHYHHYEKQEPSNK